MKSIFDSLLLPSQFKVEKDLQIAYGTMDRYHVILRHLMQQRQLVIQYQIAEAGQEQGLALREFLTAFAAERKHINSATYQGSLLLIHLNAKGKQLAEQVKEVLVSVTDYLVAHQAEECCGFCGNRGVELNGIYQIDDTADIMCAECFQRKSVAMEQSDKKKKKTNLAAGIVGAVFGSIVGVICWVLIYQLGYIAGITGFIMMVCCMKGFELLGGRLNKAGVVISILIGVVMLFAAEYLSLGIELYKAWKVDYELNLLDGIRMLPYYLEDPSTSGEFWGIIVKDLMMGYAFMALASVSFIRQSLRAVTGGEMKKLA